MTQQQAADLVWLLNGAAEFIQDYADVCDGPDGEQSPNQAMCLVSQIDAALATLHAMGTA